MLLLIWRQKHSFRCETGSGSFSLRMLGENSSGGTWRHLVPRGCEDSLFCCIKQRLERDTVFTRFYWPKWRTSGDKGKLQRVRNIHEAKWSSRASVGLAPAVHRDMNGWPRAAPISPWLGGPSSETTNWWRETRKLQQPGRLQVLNQEGLRAGAQVVVVTSQHCRNDFLMGYLQISGVFCVKVLNT